MKIALASLVGLPLFVYAFTALVALASGAPVVPPGSAEIAIAALLAAGTTAYGLAKRFPGWFRAIEGGEIVVPAEATTESPYPEGFEPAPGFTLTKKEES